VQHSATYYELKNIVVCDTRCKRHAHSTQLCGLLYCTTLQHTATHCNTLQHIIPEVRLGCFIRRALCGLLHCNTLQHTATHCITLYPKKDQTASFAERSVGCYTSHCNTLHHTATHCNALQQTASHLPKERSGRFIRRALCGLLHCITNSVAISAAARDISFPNALLLCSPLCACLFVWNVMVHMSM